VYACFIDRTDIIDDRLFIANDCSADQGGYFLNIFFSFHSATVIFCTLRFVEFFNHFLADIVGLVKIRHRHGADIQIRVYFSFSAMMRTAFRISGISF